MSENVADLVPRVTSSEFKTEKMSVGAELLKPLISAMKFGGLWFDFGDTLYGKLLKWFNITRTVIALVIWVTQLFYLYIGGPSFLLSESAVFIPIGLSETQVALTVISNLKTADQVIQIYKKRFDAFAKEPWAKNIMKKEFDKFNKIFQVPKLGLAVFFLFYFLFPVLFDGIRSFFGKDPYVVPLPLNFLLDKPLTRNQVYYSSVFTSYLYFMIIVPRFMASEAVLMYFILFVVIDMKICIQRLRNLADDDDGTVMLQKDWDLRVIIGHHSEIVNVVNGPYQIIAYALMCQNGIAIFTNCLVLFLMKTSLGNGDLVLTMFCGTFLLLLLSISFMFNGAGYIIEQQSEDLLSEMYNTAWYKQPPRTRKYVNTMIGQGVKLLTLSYQLSPINFESFLLVLNKSYSFFTLINSKQ